MAVVFRGGSVVLPFGPIDADLVVEDGRVAALVTPGGSVAADTSIDVHGLLLFPGFIDPHVHSRDPGLTHKEDFSHSTRGAAAGGVTTILEMPNTVPATSTGAILRERVDYYSSRAWVDFGLWGLSVGSRNLDDLSDLFAAGAVGVKLFWGYALDAETLELTYAPTGRPSISPASVGEVWQVAREVARLGGLLALHCEDRAVLDAAQAELGHQATTYPELLAARPATAETSAVAVAAEIALATGCRINAVHLSSGRSAQIVRAARRAGGTLTGETCPHYLTLSADEHDVAAGRVKVYPPVRGREDQQSLWAAIVDGSISTVGSDHAPHTIAEKQQPLGAQPAGMPGVQTLGPLLVDAMCRGVLTPERLAAIAAENPSRLYGMYPRKGALLPGSDADIAIVDPAAATVVRTADLEAKNPYCAWDGRELKGAITMSFVRGRKVSEGGRVVADEPAGRFVPAGARRPPR